MGCNGTDSLHTYESKMLRGTFRSGFWKWNLLSSDSGGSDGHRGQKKVGQPPHNNKSPSWPQIQVWSHTQQFCSLYECPLQGVCGQSILGLYACIKEM